MKNVRFTDLLSNIVDNRGKTCPTADTGFPLIATNCVKSHSLYPTFERVRFVSEDTYKTWFRGHPAAGDILFVNKGSPGDVCLVPDPVPFCIAQDMVAIRANPDAVYPPYLFAALRSEVVQSDIRNMHVGTMIPHFKKGDFEKLFIPLPDEQLQKVIGDTYMDLSQKIESNRRMNETLEAMARALFRDWFVDFGPTRAKMAGTAPYLSPDLWSLFPDRLDDEGKPEGWEFETVIEQADWINGAAYKNMHFSDAPDALPVIKIAELKNGVSGNTAWTATDLGSRYLIEDGELLFSWSGNPDTSIDTFLWSGGKAWLNQHIFAVRENGKRSKPFLHAMLKYLKPDFAELARNKQTTGLGHVTKADMQRMLICTGSQPVHDAFDQLITPIFDRAFLLQMETRTLAETRDLLLPRLMSGELRVADLDQAEKETAA